jgi:hypothetical protein
MADTNFIILDHQDPALDFKILEWVTIRRYGSSSSVQELLGALVAPFSTYMFVESGNDFFWKKCINCLSLIDQTCVGGFLGANSLPDSSRNTCVLGYYPYDYNSIKSVQILHPPLLTFSDYRNRARYNYCAVGTNEDPLEEGEVRSLTEQFTFAPYERANTYTDGKVCTGNLELWPNSEPTRLKDLFFPELRNTLANEDLFKAKHIAPFEEWLTNFATYFPRFLDPENSRNNGRPLGHSSNHYYPRAETLRTMWGNRDFCGSCGPTNSRIDIYPVSTHPTVKLDTYNKKFEILGESNES